ncbi:transcription factor Rbf1p [[Candida] jaroonii]|uniref:Transcription factor Rbf1p n=1 Tax=[Candida] jaroonii TaxID=467808 RepID=A0ACA9YGJ5_9ASCO|nr:transcription factor Rbf1p [[Candida] jaroonii]
MTERNFSYDENYKNLPYIQQDRRIVQQPYNYIPHVQVPLPNVHMLNNINGNQPTQSTQPSSQSPQPYQIHPGYQSMYPQYPVQPMPMQGVQGQGTQMQQGMQQGIQQGIQQGVQQGIQPQMQQGIQPQMQQGMQTQMQSQIQPQPQPQGIQSIPNQSPGLQYQYQRQLQPQPTIKSTSAPTDTDDEVLRSRFYENEIIKTFPSKAELVKYIKTTLNDEEQCRIVINSSKPKAIYFQCERSGSFRTTVKDSSKRQRVAYTKRNKCGYRLVANLYPPDKEKRRVPKNDMDDKLEFNEGEMWILRMIHPNHNHTPDPPTAKKKGRPKSARILVEKPLPKPSNYNPLPYSQGTSRQVAEQQSQERQRQLQQQLISRAVNLNLPQTINSLNLNQYPLHQELQDSDVLAAINSSINPNLNQGLNQGLTPGLNANLNNNINMSSNVDPSIDPSVGQDEIR